MLLECKYYIISLPYNGEPVLCLLFLPDSQTEYQINGEDLFIKQ